MKDLLIGLNSAQLKAVAHRDGPLVVFAGAGSGKTRIITTRIAQLVEQGTPPWEILAVTFTNKAAGEMKSRVQTMCPEAKRSVISTFHSACARWLREFAPELGYNSNFTIYDDADASSLLKKIIKAVNPKGDLATLVKEMKRFLHLVKTNGLFPGQADQVAIDNPSLVPDGGLRIYQVYQETLAEVNAMDFSDLLMNVLLLLRKNEKVRDILQNRFKYIMVDEFQDTNRTQFELINLLAQKHSNIFVVGDDDQSIYSWRGATPTNIINFDQTWNNCKSIALEQNYRCSGNIVKAASTMILNNKNRAEKTLFTEALAGDPIDLRLESDAEMEAWWIIQEINDNRSTYSFDDCAIFYRTNAQSRVLEEALTRQNIPYRIFGSLEFYSRMEVKDLLAWLKLIINDKDEVSFRRVINVPARGLGQKAVESVVEEAKTRNLSVIDACEVMANEKWPRIGTKLKYFSDLYRTLKKEFETCPLEEILTILIEAIEYGPWLEKKYAEQYVEKMDNIH